MKLHISRLITAAGLAAGSWAVSQGQAQTLNWNNAAGGSAATSTNWNPNQVPVAANDLVWNLANTYAVSFGSTTTASRTHTYKRGAVTVTVTNPHTISAGLTIGDVSGDVATMTFTGGTMTSNALSIVGDGSGSTGTLNVNDDDADLIFGGTSDLTIGNNGTGTLSITGGGLVSVADQFIAGSNSTSVSTVTVSGQLSVNPFTVSTLDVNGANQSRIGAGGDATLNVLNGGLAHFADDLVVGNGAASTSSITVQGQALIARATLDVDGDLLLGRNPSAAVAAGAGTLNVNSDGRAVVGGTLFVAGDPDGGTAMLHMAAGGEITTRSLAVGNGFTFDLDGGNLKIDGGVFTWNATTASAAFNGGAGNPVVTLMNGATATLSPVIGARSLFVGAGAGANTADFDVRSAAQLTINGGEVILGDDADDTGGMIVTGTGSTLDMQAGGGDLFVGLNGTGRFEVELGGRVEGDRLFIARNTGSDGFCSIESPGTTAEFRDVQVGGSVGGAGHLMVSTQAVLTVTSSQLRVNPLSRIDVAQAGVIQSSAPVQLDGLIEMEDQGVLNAPSITVSGTGRVTGPNDLPGAATVNGQTTLENGAELELVNGDLAIGSSTSTIGFRALDGSLVAVGSRTLTLHDQNRATVDEVTIAGGHIVAPNGLEIVTPTTSGTLDGFGTITTPELFIESGGSVITSTGAGGITINGTFRNNSGMIDGTKYTFNVHPGTGEGGWTGAGTINARVAFNAGTEANALANMTMGLASVTDGVTFVTGSEFHANTRTVTLLDSNGVLLASLNDFNGGTITSAQPMSLGAGRTLAGTGTIDGTLNVNAGKLQPGFAAGDRTHSLMFEGTLTFSTASEFTCEIAGLVNNDGLFVDGTANLSGTVRAVMIDGHVPQLGDTYFIMQIEGAMNGEFTDLIAPRGFHIIYGFNDAHTVSLFYCPPDFDEDGFLTGIDFDLFVAAFESGDMAADYDGDGFLTGIDFDVFVQDFEHGCG